MAVLHYGNSEIELTDDDVKSLTRDVNLWEPGLHRVQLESGGWIQFVTGPGCPIWIDQRTPAEPSAHVL
jgi:hypothetical protein